LNLIFDSF